MSQALTETDLSNSPPGNAAWTDVLGFPTVRWPASWTVQLAVLAWVFAVSFLWELRPWNGYGHGFVASRVLKVSELLCKG